MEQLVSEFADGRLVLGMLAGFASVTLQGYAGIGGGLIFVPSLALLYGPIDGIASATPAALVGQFPLLPAAIRQANWKEVGPVLLGILLAAPVGTIVLVSADQTIVRYGMGTFILICALLLLVNVQYRGPRGRVTSTGVGLLSGGITGTVGIPAGLIFGMYFITAQVPAAVQRANNVVAASMMISMLLFGLALNGGVELLSLARSLVILPGTLIGAAFGAYLFRIAPTTWFRHVALLLLVIMGAAVIATS